MQATDGLVTHVNPADIKALWKETSEHPGVYLGENLVKSLCSAGADIHAVGARSFIITLLKKVPGTKDMLAAYEHDGQPDDVVFRVAATIPLEKRELGVMYDGAGFEPSELFRRLRDEQAR
jgi:hypothetical protein